MVKDTKREERIAKWHMKRSVSTERIKLLWTEIKAILEKYEGIGCGDSEPDIVLQGMLYAMSFDVPVQVPTSPLAYRLYKDSSDPKKWNKCAAELSAIMKEIKKEFKTFYGFVATDDLYEWMKVDCWRHCDE